MPPLSWGLGTAPSVPTRWYTAAGESWILGRTPSSTLTYQPCALVSDLKGMCSPPHGGDWGSDNVLRAQHRAIILPFSFVQTRHPYIGSVTTLAGMFHCGSKPDLGKPAFPRISFGVARESQLSLNLHFA